jgi:hypothetical protein
MTPRARILKIDDDLRLCVGVAMVAGEIDAHGDIIDERELSKAASCALGAEVLIDHEGTSVGKVVQSFALTTDVAKALGIDLPGSPAWLVALYVEDDETWKRVKAGEMSDGLSVAGTVTKG